MVAGCLLMRIEEVSRKMGGEGCRGTLVTVCASSGIERRLFQERYPVSPPLDKMVGRLNTGYEVGILRYRSMRRLM